MIIYYKDKHIAVCEKEYGVSSQESDKINMVSLLREELGKEVYPVHRLDTTTTGLMVYALNKRSAAVLSEYVTEGRLEKEYLAVVNGKSDTQGELNDLLFHDRIRNKSFVVDTERKGAKRAILTYTTEGTEEINGEELSLVRIRLITGRTHQIRVQFANIGAPLFGDGKYGARNKGEIRLHSAHLSFPHPATGQKMEFLSTPSGKIWDDFKITE